MKKHFTDWEPYEYNNANSPMNIGGVMKTRVRGFRQVVGLPPVNVAPLSSAVVTALNTSLGDPCDDISSKV
jgi:hypothetical protein